MVFVFKCLSVSGSCDRKESKEEMGSSLGEQDRL